MVETFRRDPVFVDIVHFEQSPSIENFRRLDIMKIFISYRRDDSGGYTGRLFDHLRAHFGKRDIFRDIDTIRPGDDFRSAVENAIGTCDLVLVMIGRQWLNITDAQGRRRLDNPQDLVRLEVASALANPRVRVIPVLVGGSSMPGAHELPDDLQPLSRRNAFELSDRRFQYDTNQLISEIGESEDLTGVERLKRVIAKVWRIGLAVLVLLLIGYAARYMLATQQKLQYNVSNQLAQSIQVYGNDDFEGIVAPGETRTFTRLSRADFPLSVRWEIKKIGSYGDDMSETIRQVDQLQTVTVDNKIGQSTYFHPVISSTLDQQCRISINDATKNEAPAGFINPHSERVTSGYFLWRDDSNVTLYCNNKPMWFGIRKGVDSSRLSLPKTGDGNLEITFFPPNSSP